MSRLTAATLVALITLAACEDAAVPPLAPAAPSLAKVKPVPPFVLFQGSHDQGAGEIYSMRLDGTALTRLTIDAVVDATPDVAPSGTAFAWSRFSGDGQTAEIHLQNLDGTQRRQLTTLALVATTPRYSPDGSRVAFAAGLPGLGSDIYVVKVDGTGLVRLTAPGLQATAPTWSPDGARIAFQGVDGAGVPGLYVMPAGGGGQTLVMTCPGQGCGRPSWSPVANEIAVEHLDGTGIIVADAAGGGLTGHIPPGAAGGVDRMPTWTKDGTRVVFASTRGGNGSYDLYSALPVRAWGASPALVRLTNIPGGNELTPASSR